MNEQIVKKRIKDVLNVDSINTTQPDFLLTHVPFRNIRITNDLTGNEVSKNISEDEVYYNYFLDSDIYDKHQLILVDGSSGSGKSHFIRWIHAKLTSEDNQRDVVLMIRRSDNTLKGTINQFLSIDEVKGLKNRDVYERLVKANQNVSKDKFKYEIYHKFQVEISDNSTDSILKSIDKKNLRELLSSSEFEERMLALGGPIDRIYSKIVNNNSESNEDVIALFNVEDFTTDYDFNEELRKTGSRRANKMANKLLPEIDDEYYDVNCNPKIVTEYMNSLVETVIQSCAGIEQGDFQQIFKEIRQELYSQGKNLILLIEDITSCTGINKDLLNALILQHTGTNESDHMCRLISVIGTTTEYYKTFRDNYIDRITTKITIEDGSIGSNNDDLIQFVAKYLNVMSLSSTDVQEWYKNGALEENYPVHDDLYASDWDSYNYNGKKLSIFPFTKNAIISLYNSMNQHKTPRYIIRKLIEPAVNNIIEDKANFPKYLKGKSSRLDNSIRFRIGSIISNLEVSEEDKDKFKDRLTSLICYWGDGTLNIKDGKIGEIPIKVFDEFSLQKFSQKVLENHKNDINTNTVASIDIKKDNIEITKKIDVKPNNVRTNENKQYNEFCTRVNEWYHDKKPLMKGYEIRDEICEFIFSSIEWQREGVPLIARDIVKGSSYTLIAIDRQDRGLDKGLIVLETSEELYQLLIHFGKYKYIGKSSWDFPNSGSSLYFATAWLERNKSRFIDVVKGYKNNNEYPDYIKCSIIAEVYRNILNGDNDYRISKISDIKPELFLMNLDKKVQNKSLNHSKEWNDLVEKIIYIDESVKKNNYLIQEYFNIIQGKGSDSRIRVRVFNYLKFKDILNDILKDNLEVSNEELEKDKCRYKDIDPKEYLNKIILRLERVANSEIVEAKTQYSKCIEYLGLQEDEEVDIDDIKDLLNMIIEFYQAIEINKINVNIRTNEVNYIKDKCIEIFKSLNIINSDFTKMSTIEKLITFSSNPINVIKEFNCLLDKVKDDMNNVTRIMKAEKDSLARSGQWKDNKDKRFIDKKYVVDKIVSELEVK